MAGYEKQTWIDKVSDVTAERMNHIEKGIEDAGKTGGVETGSVIGWTGAEVPEGYEEVDSSLLPSNSGVEVGTIVDWEDGVEVPEGWEVVETSIPTPDFSQKIQITLDTSTPYTVDEDAFFQIMGELNASTNGSEISVQADGKMFYYMWSKESMTNVAPVTPLKKGTVLTLVTLTTSSIRIWKMPILKKKQIKKVAVTELDPITGSIVDGTNIDNKTTNTYSANTIDNLVTTTTNGNGKAIKFPDGTMICRGTITISSTTFNTWGQMYGGTFTVNHAFPVEFIETPSINLTPHNLGAIYERIITAKQITSVSIMRPTSSTGAVSIDYIAIGRWK